MSKSSLIITLAVLATCPVTASAADFVVRSALRVTPAAERQLNRMAIEITRTVKSGENPTDVAERACGIVSGPYSELLRQANGDQITVQPYSREMRFPACFVRRTNIRSVVLPDETLRAFADRNVGAAGDITIRSILSANASLAELAVRYAADPQAALDTVLPKDADLLVPYATEAVVYQLRPEILDPPAEMTAFNDAIRGNRPGAENQGGASAQDVRLEDDIDPADAVKAACPEQVAPEVAWPFDADVLRKALDRTTQIRQSWGYKTKQPVSIAIVDNGLRGFGDVFKSDYFALNGDRGHDEDTNTWVGDTYGANVYTRLEPVAFAKADSPFHGTRLVALALGGPALRDESSSYIKLRVISIVDSQRGISPKGPTESYRMPADSLFRALSYARETGVGVANLSVSTTQSLETYVDAIRALRIVLVVAAGNRATNLDRTALYPAVWSKSALPDLQLTVAAYDPDGCLSDFSGRGPKVVDLAAPGRNLSTIDEAGNKITVEGTSQATALVSFAVALLMGEQVSPSGVKQRLLASVELSPNLSGNVRSEGALNIAKAVSLHEDIVQTDATAKTWMLGQLDPISFSQLCPGQGGERPLRLLKVARRVDGGDPSKLRVTVLWRETGEEVLYCKPATAGFGFTQAGQPHLSVAYSELRDLVPKTGASILTD